MPAAPSGPSPAISNKLTEQEVFNRYDAERYLLLAGDLPGYNVRLALRSAGAARGEVIGEVTVEHQPALVDVTVQNLGSRELGRWGALARAQIFGLTGLGDRTTPGRVQHRRHARAADGPGRPRFPARQRGPRDRRPAHLRLGQSRPRQCRRSTSNRAPCSPPWRRAIPSSGASCATLRGAIGFDLIDQKIDFNTLPAERGPAAGRLRPAQLRLARARRRQSRATRSPSRAGGSARASNCAAGSTY